MPIITMQIMIKQNGFTLLEVMIALVIFSIGLIGLAGLQGISMQNNQIAYSRTIATQYAYDLADRIRNNPAGNYSTAAIPGSAPSKLCITSTNNCNTAEMVTYDLWEWSAALKDKNSNLVNPQMFITKNGNDFQISIGWNENRDNTVVGTYDCTATPPTPAGVECVNLAVTP